jgi:hypothetical protein
MVDPWVRVVTGAYVDFCGERLELQTGQPFVIGRTGDLAIDDNPYLHRSFLELSWQRDVWWLANVGSQLTATVADRSGAVQASLAPGSGLPLVFSDVVILFTAGPTTYEIDVHAGESSWVPVSAEHAAHGETTIGRTSLTPDQRLLVVALCEPFLKRPGAGFGSIASSADVAARLGWTMTRFNRKLDNVCQKFAKDGVRGLHGGATRLATNRRARLVEHVLAARIVTVDDLRLLGDLSSP